MAGISYQVFFDDPPGTAQIDNFNITDLTVTPNGDLILYCAGDPKQLAGGQIASYSSGQWKRIVKA